MLRNLLSEKSRPFKLWTKGLDFDPNINRFKADFPAIRSDFYFNYFYSHFRRQVVRPRRVVVRASAHAYISAISIEAFRKVLSPYFRKNLSKGSKFYIRCFGFLHLTKKPAEVRMGGGKGSKSRGFFCPVRPGQIMFEVVLRDPKWVSKVFNYASRKIGVRTSITVI